MRWAVALSAAVAWAAADNCVAAGCGRLQGYPATCNVKSWVTTCLVLPFPKVAVMVIW